MARINCFDPINFRIESMPKGEVFIISDFSDLADDAAIRKVLSRLEEDGKIRRIMRGVYDFPEYNEFLGEYIEPKPDKVAHALARNYGWTIVPCGDTALNMLGLSTQVPAIWLYVSDGTYKEYTYGNTTIKFKRTTNKEISKISYKTALVIQALKALGKENITDDIISKISSTITDDEKATMFAESKYATAWIYDIIKEICGGAK
ncbi:MAG: hypothetical protein E7614_06140 [Ruminococcaceae bacterium]|nr:hypothetical protein [Oscillospiraceae bacterium]